jgi:Na+-translocating ferredoxin:NAD+ oxidoreductase RnfG subunit
MNRIFAPIAIAGLMVTGSYAFAGEEVSQAGMAQQNKMMKDCLAKHASSDNKMTKDDIEKACREETKSQKDSSSKMSDTPQK